MDAGRKRKYNPRKPRIPDMFCSLQLWRKSCTYTHTHTSTHMNFKFDSLESAGSSRPNLMTGFTPLLGGNISSCEHGHFIFQWRKLDLLLRRLHGMMAPKAMSLQMHFKFTKLLFECKTKIHHARCPGLISTPVLCWRCYWAASYCWPWTAGSKFWMRTPEVCWKVFPKMNLHAAYIYYIYNMFKDGFSWGENMVG